MRPITIALAKGKIEEEAVCLFKKAGYDVSCFSNKGRKLILEMDGIQVVLTKPPDVITYIELGACDIGVVGKDTIMEWGGTYYEVLDLDFCKCKFALAAQKNVDFYNGFNKKTIATKYPNVAEWFCAGKGIDAHIIKIEGSVEIAPLIGLANGIIDIVETGRTLEENGLEVVEDIAAVSTRAIVNVASMKMHKVQIQNFLSNIRSCLNTG